MESHEVLRVAFKKVGCKNVAAEMHLSLSLIHQWSRGNGGKSAAANPLDRVARLLEVTADRRLADWICAQQNGFFVENPPAKTARAELPPAGLAALKDLNQMETALLETLAQPGPPARAEKLRRLWEVSKSNMERVVRALENGKFRQKLMVWFIKVYPIWDAATPGGLI
jgi:hypothetical protein